MTRKLISKPFRKKQKNQTKKWLPLLFIVFIFVTPFFIAKYVKDNNEDFNLGTTNRGNLLTPATPLNSIPLMSDDGTPLAKALTQKKWGLVYIAPQTCEKTCIANIHKMYQLKEAIFSKAPSFYLMVITNQNDAKTNPAYKMIRSHYPAILYIGLTAIELDTMFKILPAGTQNINLAVLYIVDPNGYLVMSYPPSEAGSSVLKDLKKLIKG